MTDFLFVMALLVPPVCVLAGVATGAFFTHRLMRGQPPLPSLPKRAKVIEDEEHQADNHRPRAHPPTVRA